jgi:hypothetical protein
MTIDGEDLLLQLLDLVDEYTNLQKSCNQSLSKAYMSLAQAKCALGASRISKLSYDGKIEPMARLECDELDALSDALKLIRLEKHVTSILKKDAVDSETNSIGVRRRRDKKEQESEGVEMKEKTLPRKRDPLQMFGGILAPQSLRNAQQGFKDALADMVSMANITTRLRNIESQLSPSDQEEEDATEK